MDRTRINDLKVYLRENSATLGSPDFMDLLEISSEGKGGDHVFVKLVKSTLDEFEKLSPTYLYSPVIAEGDGMYEFVDTFGDYLAGTITEDYIVLVPTTIINASGSWVYAYRSFTYTAPWLSYVGSPYGNQVYYAARRPMMISYDENNQKLSDDSYIYFLNVKGHAEERRFLEFLEYTILIYLRDQKSDLMYPDTPIDFLTGLPERIQELFQKLEGYRNSPFKNAQLLR